MNAPPPEPRLLYELFHAALALPPDQRAAYLDARCPPGPGREKLARLLAADATIDERAPPAGGAAASASTSDPAGDASTSDLANPAAPWAVPGLEIIRELGRGGMGVVYEARDTRLNRLAALKVIRREDFGEKELARFRLEMEALGRLDHPHVVRVHGGGEHQGQPYCLMELLGGGSLAERLRGGPLPPKEAAGLFEGLARAVDHAHQRGVLHRDIKPANVLFSAEGVAKLCDFGLAKHVAAETGPTGSWEWLGTPSYMAPEQTALPPATPTTSIDVYGLGAALYETLTGRPPFREATVWATLESARTRDPQPPRAWNPAVPRDLEIICLKCLGKTPADRYASAAALADDLRRFLVGEPIAARPPSLAGRAWRAAARRPVHATALLLAGALLLSLVAVGVVTRFWRAAEAAERDLAALSYAHRLALADTRRAEGRFGDMLDLLNACPPEFRDWEWRYLADQCRLRAVLRGHDDITTCVAVSPDGKFIASVGADRRLVLWKWGQPRPWRAIQGDAFLRAVAVHPDSNRVATAGDDHVVRMWSASTGALLREFRGHQGAIHEVAFDAEGRWLASGGADQTARVWNVASGELAFTSKPHGGRVFALAFDPTTGALRASGEFQAIVTWDWRSGRRLATWRDAAPGDEPVSVDGLCADPRRNRLFVADRAFRIARLDPITGAVTREITAHQDDVNCLCLLGDDTLASVSDDSTLALWNAETLAPRQSLRGHRGHINFVASHPAGNMLVTASDDQGVGVWTGGDATPAACQPTRANARHACFHPQGGMWVTGHDDGVARVRDAATGAAIVDLPSVEAGVTSLCFNRRGDRLAVAASNCTVTLFSVGDWRATRRWSWPRPNPRTEGGRDPTRRTGDIAREMRELGPVTTLAPVRFTPDDRAVACGGHDGRVRVFAVEDDTPRVVEAGHVGPISGLAFDPAGQTLATCGLDRAIVTRDWPAGKALRTLRGHQDRVCRIAFSPDGRRLASVGADAAAIVWNVASGEKEHTLTGHSGDVRDVAFHPGGKRLATAGWDGAARVWDVENGRELLTLRPRAARSHAVCFRPAGDLLLTCGDHGWVEPWHAPARPRGW